jgi:hypothetical protein
LTNPETCDIIIPVRKKEVVAMTALEKALFETHGVELDSTDVVRLEQNYCEPTIVDVIVIEASGKRWFFGGYDTTLGIFPY